MTARALLAGLLALVAGMAATAAPDARRGEEVYARCIACHAPAADRVGPRHCGVFGRLAGTVPGFDYSPAMKRSKLRWDEHTLDRFIARPLDVVPGSSMTYDGVPDRKDRADLIAYLRQLDRSPACRR